MMEAMPAINTNSIKKSNKLLMWYPKNEVVFPPSGYRELNTPANLFPNALAVNQTAINKDEYFKGDN